MQHVRTATANKAPSASTINYGEIAVNYNHDTPAIYIKDNQNNIVKFISEPYFEKIVGTGVTENDGETFTPLSEIIQQDEMTVSAALNDLNDRKADKSYVDDAVSSITIYVDSQLDSASTNPVENRVIYEALEGIRIEVDTELDSASTNPVENRVIYRAIVDDEEAISAALNDLNDRKADVSYVNEAISANTIEVDSQLDSASTNPVENRVLYQVIIDNEEVTASALNDLNDRKADKTYVDEAISASTIEVDSQLDSASTNPVENRVIYQVIVDDEEAISSALNDLNSRKADKSYVDSAVSSITIDVDSTLDSASTNPVENSAITSVINEITDDIREMDEVVSAALNDLNDKKADVSYVDEAISSVTIYVDSQLDSASTNPVENRAVWQFFHDDEIVIAESLNDLNDRVSGLESAPATAVTTESINAWNTKLSGVTVDGHAGVVSNGVATVSGSFECTTNKVTGITSASTDTQYPSAKATYDEIHPKVITTGGTNATITIEANKVYNLGTLTGTKTFSLSNPSDANIVNHYYWTFDTSSTAPTITWPSGLTWYGGSAPSVAANGHYEVSVLNNIAVVMEIS